MSECSSSRASGPTVISSATVVVANSGSWQAHSAPTCSTSQTPSGQVGAARKVSWQMAHQLIEPGFDGHQHDFLLVGEVLVERHDRDVGLGADVANAGLLVALGGDRVYRGQL